MIRTSFPIFYLITENSFLLNGETQYGQNDFIEIKIQVHLFTHYLDEYLLDYRNPV
jgi:hypothetical protein